MDRDTCQQVAAALRLLANAFEAMPAETSQPDGWEKVRSYTAKILPARVVNAACASGQIEGAVKRGKSWIARRSAIDSWLASQREPDASDVSADGILRRWGVL